MQAEDTEIYRSTSTYNQIDTALLIPVNPNGGIHELGEGFRGSS